MAPLHIDAVAYSPSQTALMSTCPNLRLLFGFPSSMINIARQRCFKKPFLSRLQLGAEPMLNIRSLVTTSTQPLITEGEMKVDEDDQANEFMVIGLIVLGVVSVSVVIFGVTRCCQAAIRRIKRRRGEEMIVWTNESRGINSNGPGTFYTVASNNPAPTDLPSHVEEVERDEEPALQEIALAHIR